ncbi:MAG TPA: oligosaccharide flippase family protein [Aggregatilineales bacterium]|nr:oligosaccharide flippase family protein [Anaerolineales bacterium]HRE48786.1 oligosaccharide flippase family protein [Aggregatilineales bacterium]
MYRQLTINTLINLLNLTVNIIVGFLIAPYFIHSLGSELYGIWVFTLSLSVTRGALIIFDLGILSALVKYVAEYHAQGDPRKVNEAFSGAFLTYLLIGGVTALGLLVFAAAFSGSLFRTPPEHLDTARSLLFILALQTLFDFPALAVQGVLEGLQRYDVTRGLNIVRIFLYSGLSLLFLQAGMGVYALAWATFLSELVRLLGHIYWGRRAFPAWRLVYCPSRAVLRAMVGLSSKMFVFALATTVYNQMDQIILATRLSTTALTDYDISARLHTLVFALTTLIGPFMVPAASALYAQADLPALRRLMLRATRFTAAFAAPATILLIVLAESMTRYWIGAEYLHTVTATRLFLSYLLMYLLIRVGQNMLIGMNRLAVLLPALLISTIVNLLVSLIAVGSLGVTGVILGTVVGNAAACLLYLYAFRRDIGITFSEVWRRVIWRTYPQALMAGGAVFLLATSQPPRNLFQVGLYGALGMLVYFGLFAFTGLERVERQALTRIILRQPRPTTPDME